MEAIYACCPRGHYLSDGAYKEVFKVFSVRDKRLEAVSVMNIRAIEQTGNEVRMLWILCCTFQSINV
ncbi:hypothetical protein PINS_up000025 [Pythium insidiosum]|nr:hypothetical protein PINS_up000025 [Pythium insidiosum]